jgi:hypothetical protein
VRLFPVPLESIKRDTGNCTAPTPRRCSIQTRSTMIKIVQNTHPLIFLLVATTLEVSGDALIRLGIYNHTELSRVGLMVTGAALLFGIWSVGQSCPVGLRAGGRPLYRHSFHGLASNQSDRLPQVS